MTFEQATWTTSPPNWTPVESDKPSNTAGPRKYKRVRRDSSPSVTYGIFIDVNGVIVHRPVRPDTKAAVDHLPTWIPLVLSLGTLGLFVGFVLSILYAIGEVDRMFYPASAVAILSALSLVIALGTAKKRLRGQ